MIVVPIIVMIVVPVMIVVFLVLASIVGFCDVGWDTCEENYGQ